jgi:UrcA family protein
MTTAIKNQSQSIISVIAASVFMLSWAAYSPEARAADETVIGVEKVSYGDLNLATEAGAAVLYRRLRRAAALACSPRGSLAEVVKAGWRACYAKAMNSAVSSVNKPMLTALHNRVSGISTADTSSPTAELAAK